MKLNIYNIHDTDRGNECYIVATDIRKAIDKFYSIYQYDPDTIYNITADGEPVIITEIEN